jgi:diguanylate cyclase (GGDEF)-like protein/PAS domain S-box-containing protein
MSENRTMDRFDNLDRDYARNSEFASGARRTPVAGDASGTFDEDGTHALGSHYASDGRFELVVQATEDGFWDRNLITGVTYISPRLRELLGYPAQELADADRQNADGQIEQHLHPEDRARVSIALLGHLETHSPYRIEYRLRTTAGNYRWFDARGQATWDPHGKPIRFTGSLRDITAHKETQIELEWQQNYYAALQRTTQTIAQIRERDALLQAICRIAVEHGHVSLAWIGLTDKQSGRIDPVAGQGSAQNMLHGLGLPVYRYTSAHCKVTAAAIHTGVHQVANDFLGDPRLTDGNSIAMETGIRAMASFPLREGERVVGMFNLYGDEAGFFSEPLIALMHEIAMDVSFALDNIRRERDHRAAERALRVSEEQFRQLASNIPDVFWVADAQDNRLLYVSPAFERIWGLPADGLDGSNFDWMDAVHPADQARVRANYERGPLTKFDEEYRVARPDGSIRWVHARAFPVADMSGKVVRITGIAQDITERRDYEARLRHLAHFDGLTGLPNRLLFHDRMKQTLAHVERVGGTVAVMFAGIDHFKLVNDTLGHAAGDLLLQAVAMRLSHIVRPIDTVARLGGDEFALMLCDLAAAEDAVPVAQQIMAAFEQPFNIDGSEVFVTLSIGIASYPVDSANADALLRNADIAMYRAKEVGRGSFQFYAAEMNARSLERLNLSNHLRRALERKEFFLEYQPKADLATGTITGVEVLLRWNSPELGAVVPGRFIQILEESGHILPVGEWVMESACRQIRAWMDKGIVPVPIAVNLSGRQLRRKGLDVHIKSILDKHGVDPRLIELEVTESVLMQRSDDVSAVLGSLKAMGIRLAIDDFGTGRSSLSYLKSFPLDTLKIDRSFIKDVIADGDAALIARAVISMAGNLRLRVVAEGVESQAQLAFLASCGCDEIQGNYFSPPVSADDCTRMLADQRKLALPASGANDGRRTLLLVDDETRILSALKRVLRRDNYHILTAASAAEGLELLACNRIAVVVTDQRMPEMAGAEFLRRVKDLYPDTVRIMLSGYMDFHSIAEAINQGAVYKFLTKPWDDQQLRANIGEAFRHHDATMEIECTRCDSSTNGCEPQSLLPPPPPVGEMHCAVQCQECKL